MGPSASDPLRTASVRTFITDLETHQLTDGMADYVPCTKPLNMTITIDGQPEIPLHPLDLTTQSQTDPSSSTCVGLIQTGDGVMDNSTTVSDMILGVAFLRNVYTVIAYDQPDTQGVFPNNSDSAIDPQVGLLSLTNTTQAMQEFNNVRLLNQPSSPTSGAANNKLSVGIDVLLALVGVIAACVTLFGLRWLLVRRRMHRKPHFDVVDPKRGGPLTTTFQLAPRASLSSVDLVPAHMSPGMSIAGNSSTRTVVGQEDDGMVDEFGFRRIKNKHIQGGDDDGGRQVSYLNLDPGDPSGWCDTLVDSTTIDFPADPEAAAASSLKAAVAFTSDNEPISSSHEAALAAAAVAGLPMHHWRKASDIGGAGPEEANSLTEPLLSHARDDSGGSGGFGGAVNRRSAVVNAVRGGGGDNDDNDDQDHDDLAEFGVGGAGAVRESMAGIGTAARSSRVRATTATLHGKGGGSSGGSLGSLSNASFVIGPGLRFPSVAPGERLSGYSILSEAAEFGAAAIPYPTPLPPPPPPKS